MDRFYRVIGDGYNQTAISFKYNLNEAITPESIFIHESHNNIGKPWFYEEWIKPTQEKVTNPSLRLKELMEWNRKHVIGFNGCKQIRDEEYRLAEFKEIYTDLFEKTESVIKNWKIEALQYLLDTKDASYRKYLFLNGENKSMVFEFGNYIH